MAPNDKWRYGDITIQEIENMYGGEMKGYNGGEIENMDGLWRTRSNGRVRADGSRNGDD
jgi:hypothetical protein